ncbi:hypothetical protein B0H21DRAFT_144239 [Amylocystis lapponica]|nr:hypothetical protein B0H21DRAFT_144239 [Amylocystis lapponica]
MSHPSFQTSSNKTVKFIIPPGWFTVVSAVFRKDEKQAMLVRSSVKGDSALFQSDAVSSGSRLLNQLEKTVTFPIAPKDMPVHVELSFYHPDPDVIFSKSQRAAGENNKLIEPEYLVHHVTVVPSMKPARAANDTPDYVTYNVFVQDSEARSLAQRPASEQLNSAVAVVHVVKMVCHTEPEAAASAVSYALPTIPSGSVLVENKLPPPPPPADIVQGYNVTLDAPRPAVVDTYLHQYDTIFLVDDSGSMGLDQRWQEACTALLSILDRAIDNNAKGISLYFFNATQSIDLKGTKLKKFDVRAVLDRVQPSGGTPIGERISEHLGRRIDLLDKAAGTPQYKNIKPLDVVVLTDGEPPGLSDTHPFELKNVLLNATARLRRSKQKHHPNAVCVRFVQVGQEPRLRAAMEALVQLDTDNMVDTIAYEGVGSLTPEKLDRILVGGVHPNMRV